MLAGSAFKDPEVVKLAEKFVPILVDADVEKEICSKFGANSFPRTVFVDLKGNSVGEVRGAVDKGVFLGRIEAAIKKIGPVKPKKQAKDLEDAGKALAKAREKKEWKATVKQVLVIEKINHEGTILDAAREARKEAVAEARVRIDEAKRLATAGKTDEARKILLKVASDFEGLDEAGEAKQALKAMDPPADAGGGPKGEGK